MLIKIRIESNLERLDRTLKSDARHLLGNRLWCLRIENTSGYTNFVRIDASDQNEAEHWASLVLRRIETEGWADNIKDAVLHESSILERFTDYACDFTGKTYVQA